MHSCYEQTQSSNSRSGPALLGILAVDSLSEQQPDLQSSDGYGRRHPERLGMTPSLLWQTVTTYSSFCPANSSTDFERLPSMLIPLSAIACNRFLLRPTVRVSTCKNMLVKNIAGAIAGTALSGLTSIFQGFEPQCLPIQSSSRTALTLAHSSGFSSVTSRSKASARCGPTAQRRRFHSARHLSAAPRAEDTEKNCYPSRVW